MSWLSRTLKAVGLHIRTTLVAGVLIILPIAVTFLLLKFVFDFFDPVLKPVFEYAINRYTPGMGIIALVFIIYLAGVVTTHVLGRRMITLVHSMVEFIPVVRSVYRTARQATEVLSTVAPNDKFTSVVLVDFPGHGLKSIGLVTSQLQDHEGKPLLVVYVPTSPFPTSGFLVILSPEQVTPTDLPVDDAMKLIVSAGLLAPSRIGSPAYPFPTFQPPAGATFPTTGPRGRDQEADGTASNQ